MTSRAPIFFVHVMKTGGVTLLESARAGYPAEEVYPDGSIDLSKLSVKGIAFDHLTISTLRKISAERLSHLRLVAGHFPLVAAEVLGGGFDIVTLVRDPVSRTVSLLRQFQRPVAGVTGRDQPTALADMSLEEVYEMPHVFERLVHNHQTKIFSMTMADQPTGYMQVIDVDAARLALAKENLAAVAALGLTERYDDFLDVVADRFGWHVPHGRRVNETPLGGRPVSQALLRRIAADNAIDVELYAHAQDLVAEHHLIRG